MTCPKLDDGICKIDGSPCPMSYLHKMGVLDCDGPARVKSKVKAGAPKDPTKKKPKKKPKLKSKLKSKK